MGKAMAMGWAIATVLPVAAAAQTTPPEISPPAPAPVVPVAEQAPMPHPAAKRAPRPAPVDDANSDEPDVIVRGQRNLPGAVIGDIPPEQQLGPADIRSYGVSSVSDLLTELAPQIRSDRGSGGAPAVLLNGRRISGFQEVRDLPTEAIARVDILPEEVALKYGYAADQKVVNIVLRRRFRAATAELGGRVPTEGGRFTGDGNLDLLNIKGQGRLNAHITYTQSSKLTEAERAIVQTPSATTGGVDMAPYRTLLPSSRQLNTNLVYATTIFGTVGATFNGELQANDSTGLNGLSTVNGYPLTQNISSVTGHLGGTFSGTIGQWRWSLTSNLDRARNETFTDPATAGQNAGVARSTSTSGGADLLVNGSLFDVPAGSVSTSIRVGGSSSDFSSTSYRSVAGGTPITSAADVSRGIEDGQINIDVPVTSRSKGVLPGIGTLSLNGNIAVHHLSDFGTLTTRGYGVNWSPRDGIRLLASVTDQGDAPTAQQLGNPRIETPNVRIFDYVTGTTATVTSVSGGNRNLLADRRHTAKIELSVKPWKERELTFVANYITSHTDNAIVAFPTPTAAIEDAFGGRFTRVNGTLTQLDTRPINFARTERSELRYGINFSHPLKSKLQKELEAFRAGKGPNPLAGVPVPDFVRRQFQQNGRPGGGGEGGPPPGDGGPPPGGPGAGPGGSGGGGGPGGGGRGFGGGGFGGGGRNQGGGRLQFALYHTWHFTDRVLVSANGPALDLLNGDATGQSGGQSRHELEGQAGYLNNGLGVRLSLNYASATTVNGGTTGAATRLNFSGLTTVALRLFADPTSRIDLIAKHPWLRGTRASLSVDNLFNSRQRVTDQTGTTPISYQPDYLNPLGRTVRLSVRKLFF